MERTPRTPGALGCRQSMEVRFRASGIYEKAQRVVRSLGIDIVVMTPVFLPLVLLPLYELPILRLNC